MLALVASALPARAQSFNIDIDTAGPPGAGVPANSFAGAAGVAGVWRSLPATGAGPYVLLHLNGAGSSVTLARSGSAGAFQFDSPNAGGDFAKLVEDLQNIPTGTSSTLTLSGLAPGTYDIYTYAIAPDIASLRTLVAVSPSSDAQQSIGGAVPNNAFAQGVTHALHRVSIAGAETQVTITLMGGPGQSGSLNGIQIKQIASGRIYVNAAAPTGGDGHSWQTAFTDFQSALNALPAAIASAGAPGAPEVWIAAGTYTPSAPAGRAATFALVQGARYYGGFAGSETFADARDPAANPTILSGELGTPGATDNAYHVLTAQSFASLDPAATIVDGFTVRDGYADGPGGECAGGGLACANAALTLRNIRFHNNVATCVSGALHIFGGSYRVERCTFLANTSGAAGALAATSPGGFIDLYHCRFLGNVAFDGAGAILAAGSARLVNCVFTGNAANRDNAALDASLCAHADIINCTIANNTAARFNAGLVLGSGATLANSILWGNRDSQTALKLWQRQLAGSTPGQVNNSLIEGYDLAIGGSANWGANPRFANALGPDGASGTLDDNVSPKASSFAIDAGSNPLYGPQGGALAADAGGVPRFRADAGAPDIGTGPAPVVDIGAYEFQGLSCRPDVNSDGVRSVQDVFDFLEYFFTQDAYADFTRSGGITPQDLFEFLAAWFAGC